MLCRSAPIVALHGFLGCPADFDDFDVTAIEVPNSLAAIDILEGSILMGYSMGGRIAMQLAAKYPNRFSGLILIGAHPGLEEKEKPTRAAFEQHWLEIFRNQPYEEALKLWYAQPLFNSLRLTERFSAIFKRRLQHPSPWQYLQTYSLCHQPLVKIEIPTLYIYGEHDQKYAHIAKAFPNRFMIPGCGHAPHLENPQLFTSLLHTHIKKF